MKDEKFKISKSLYDLTIAKFIDLNVEAMQHHFKHAGDVPTMLFWTAYCDKHHVMHDHSMPCMEYNTDETYRDMLPLAIKNAMEEMKPLIVLFVTEGWMVEVPVTDIPNVEAARAIKPSEHPNKFEVVTMNFQIYGKQMNKIYKIMRDKETPYLTPLETEDTWGDFTGNPFVKANFDNLIAKNYYEVLNDKKVAVN